MCLVSFKWIENVQMVQNQIRKTRRVCVKIYTSKSEDKKKIVINNTEHYRIYDRIDKIYVRF